MTIFFPVLLANLAIAAFNVDVVLCKPAAIGKYLNHISLV